MAHKQIELNHRFYISIKKLSKAPEGDMGSRKKEVANQKFRAVYNRISMAIYKYIKK